MYSWSPYEVKWTKILVRNGQTKSVFDLKDISCDAYMLAQVL